MESSRFVRRAGELQGFVRVVFFDYRKVLLEVFFEKEM